MVTLWLAPAYISQTEKTAPVTEWYRGLPYDASGSLTL